MRVALARESSTDGRVGTMSSSRVSEARQPLTHHDRHEAAQQSIESSRVVARASAIERAYSVRDRTFASLPDLSFQREGSLGARLQALAARAHRTRTGVSLAPDPQADRTHAAAGPRARWRGAVWLEQHHRRAREATTRSAAVPGERRRSRSRACDPEVF